MPVRWYTPLTDRNHGASDEGDSAVHQVTDKAAITVGVTAPGWAAFLANVNAALTTISLVLGIAFLLWRWRRQAKQNSPE